MYINTQTNEYPLTEAQVKAAFPNVSFSVPFEPPTPYAVVSPTAVPDYNAMTHKAVESTVAFIDGAYVQVWEIVALGAEELEPLLSARRLAVMKQIDSDADQIYSDIMGNRLAEYTEAEAQASAYKAAGYTGDVGDMVSVWATASGNDAEWAADDILAQAAAWRTAQAAIRGQRLTHKTQVRGAATALEIDSALLSWETFVAALRDELAGALVP